MLFATFVTSFIGFVNDSEINSDKIPAAVIEMTPTSNKNLFVTETLSFIDSIGVLMKTIYPLSNLPNSATNSE